MMRRSPMRGSAPTRGDWPQQTASVRAARTHPAQSGRGAHTRAGGVCTHAWPTLITPKAFAAAARCAARPSPSRRVIDPTSRSGARKFCKVCSRSRTRWSPRAPDRGSRTMDCCTDHRARPPSSAVHHSSSLWHASTMDGADLAKPMQTEKQQMFSSAGATTSATKGTLVCNTTSKVQCAQGATEES